MLRPAAIARTVAFLAMLGAAMVVAALEPHLGEFQFGQRRLKVPVPAGLEQASPTWPELLQAFQAYQPPTNRLIEVYVEPENSAAVQAGEAMSLDPYFQLVALRKLDGIVLSSADFATQIASMEREMEAALSTVGSRIDEQVASGNTQLKEQTGVDLGLKVAPPEYLGTHRREPWGMFFSLRSTVSASDTTEATTVVSSIAAVLVNHQLLYLNAYRIDDGASALQRTRDDLNRWADDVRAANPDDPALEQQAQPLRDGIDWGRALRTGLITGAIGATAALVIGLFSRRRGSGGG